MSVYNRNSSLSNSYISDSVLFNNSTLPADPYGRFYANGDSLRRVSMDQERYLSLRHRGNRSYSDYGSVDSEVSTQAPSITNYSTSTMIRRDSVPEFVDTSRSEVNFLAPSRSSYSARSMAHEDQQDADLSKLKRERTIKFVNGVVSGIGVGLVSVPVNAISSAISWCASGVSTSAALGLTSSGVGIAGAILLSAASLAFGALLGAAHGFYDGLNSAYKGHEQGLSALWNGIISSTANASSVCFKAGASAGTVGIDWRSIVRV